MMAQIGIRGMTGSAPEATAPSTRLIKGLPAIVFLFLVGCNVSSTAIAPAPVTAELKGGSNYDFFDIQGCNRDPYGVLLNYNLASATINAQLAAMYAAGQRRIGIYIYHWDGNLFIDGKLTVYNGPVSGTLVDSTGGVLSSQVQANLANLLAAIKAAGFEQVVVGMGPQGANHMSTWPSWQESYFQENWEVIENVRPIIVASGMDYLLDLFTEGMPNKALPFYAFQLEYVQRIWQLYAAKYGTADTVGFSLSGQPGVEVEPPNVYGGVYPPLYDVHIYDDAYNQFMRVNAAMKQQPANPPWIIGEAYYNDSAEAVALQQAIAFTGKQVKYLTQWQLTSGTTDACFNTGVNVAPPALFSNYMSSGF